MSNLRAFYGLAGTAIFLSTGMRVHQQVAVSFCQFCQQWCQQIEYAGTFRRNSV
jgi:hypothetical protein